MLFTCYLENYFCFFKYSYLTENNILQDPENSPNHYCSWPLRFKKVKKAL